MTDDWKDVPLHDETDDWKDVPVNPTPKRPLAERAFNAAEGFTKGLFQGNTAGEGVPVLGPLAAKAGTAFGAALATPFSDKSFGQLYNEGRNQDEQATTEYTHDNPVAAGAKNLAGGFMLPVKGIGLANAAAETPALVRGAAGLADAVVPSMGLTYGDTALRTGDTDRAYENAKDAGMLSGGLHGAGQVGSTLFKKFIPQGLAGAAEERAFKAATGQNKKAFKQNYMQQAQELGRPVEEGEATSKINQIGRDLLSKDEAGPPVVGWLDSVKNIAPKAEAKADYYGKQIGEVGRQVDEAMPNAVSGENIANRMKEYGQGIPGLPSKSSLKNKIANEADYYNENGPMSFENAQLHKGQYKFKPVEGGLNELPQDATNAMRGAVGSEMEDTVKKLIASPDTSDQAKKQLELYTYLKSKYGSYKPAGDYANDRVMSDLSNRFVSPSDYGMGSVAGLGSMSAHHDPISAGIVGATAAALNKQVRTRGNAFMARSLDAIDQVINTPGAEKYKAMLTEAKQRGPQAAILAHEYLKKNDENYRKLTEGNPQ